MDSSTEVVVIGGGSTGTGIARDLAMRGVDVTLLEKGNLTNGTTGRMHGLLHSGARYAVSEPDIASDCIRENEVLMEISSHCIEDTGGLFVKKPRDSDSYFSKKVNACRESGIPIDVVSGDRAREIEPFLAPDIEKAIRVPDAAIDPFRLCVANAESAENHGARIETHSEVTNIHIEDDEVTGVSVRHESDKEHYIHGQSSGTEEIAAEYIVNATGPWSSEVGEMAGVDIGIRQSRGAMTVTNARQVDTVINRCRPKDDGDIFVPHETTGLLGTTDVEIDDPEKHPEEGWEVELLIDELSEVIPMLENARTLRSFWGVRPLYEPPEKSTEQSRDVSRDFYILDHWERDELYGLCSVVGGKFTTYRLMAEEASNHICNKLGIQSDCWTDMESLPGSRDASLLERALEKYGLRSPVMRRTKDRLGSRTTDVLDKSAPNPVICDCEAVTRAEIKDAIDKEGTELNAARIRTRASMGNCQGGLCSHRIAYELYPRYRLEAARLALRDLYQERWKGQRHSLWGEQLSQAMLNHALHKNTLNRDRGAEIEEIDPERFDQGDQEIQRKELMEDK